MMHRVTAVCAVALVGIFGLASCASPDATPPSTSESAPGSAVDAPPSDKNDSDDSTSGGSDASESTIPDGARAATPHFPFPVPEGWEEVEPFAEGKIGKAVAMSAVYAHPGDAEAAAKIYADLLAAAGFEAYSNPVGELTNDASLMVEGTVNGVSYKGGLDFDTSADGTARVRINLTEK